MKTVQAYQAEDGSVFATEGECAKHELSCEFISAINDFIANSGMCKYEAKQHQGMVRETILGWEAYKRVNKTGEHVMRSGSEARCED